MKKIHRRLHLTVWGILTPLVAFSALLLWQSRPIDPVGAIIDLAPLDPTGGGD